MTTAAAALEASTISAPATALGFDPQGATPSIGMGSPGLKLRICRHRISGQKYNRGFAMSRKV